MSARWGGAFTPLLVAALLNMMSWRRAFELFGALGVVWAVLFYFWYRDNPRDNKSVNAAELKLIQEGRHGSESHGNVPWAKFVRSKQVWLLCGQYFCLSYGWYFYITWLPTYLREARGLTLTSGAALATLPLFLGGCGSFLCGMHESNPVAIGVSGVVSRGNAIGLCVQGTADLASQLGAIFFEENDTDVQSTDFYVPEP